MTLKGFMGGCSICAMLLLTLPIRAQSTDGHLQPNAAEVEWVQSTLANMTLEQRVGQMLMPAIPADVFSSPNGVAEFVRMADELGVGCFTLRVRSAEEGVALVSSLQASREIPLLISVNFERGTGHYWSDGTIFPRQMALAATGDPETARAVGEFTAREAMACGIHWTLVPICDVNINPDNPIINIRSYGEDVGTVGRFAAAFTEGCQTAGMLACAKHFPGHGDTATDSHLGLATVDGDRQRLDAVEFPPFLMAIDAGVGSVMTSHIWFPALMGDEGQIPATVSHRVLTDLLRGEMGFTGLIVTDSMSMQGVTDRLGPGDAAAAAVNAGADVLLDGPDNAAAHAGLMQAVRNGVISEERINESVERILRMKAALGLQRETRIDAEAALALLRLPDATAAARDMAQRAITVVRNDQDVLPLDPSAIEIVMHLALFDDWSGWQRGDLEIMTDELRERFPQVMREIALETTNPELTTQLLDPSGDMTEEEIAERCGLAPERIAEIVSRCEAADVTIVTAFIRTASHRAHIGLGESQVALVNALRESGRPVILVVLGSPYTLMALCDVPCQVLTYDASRLFAEVLPGALIGEFPLSGRLPVTLPGVANRGHGLQVPARPMPDRDHGERP